PRFNARFPCLFRGNSGLGAAGYRHIESAAGMLQLPASSTTMTSIVSPASVEPGLVFAFHKSFSAGRHNMAAIPLTVRGAARLKEELHRLKTLERQAVINAMAEAREQGDLSENAEYDAAKEKQGFIEG